MKVIINKNETYEIKIPNEVNANDFMNLLTSFDNIVKLIKFNLVQEEFSKTKTIQNNSEYKNLHQKKLTESLRLDGTPRKPYIRKIRRSNLRTYSDTREKALDLLQYAYHGNKEDKKRIEKIAGFDWAEISKSIHGLKKRYNILPQEVGLTRFGDEKTKSFIFRIPNYIIKSYTGYFDENETTNKQNL